MWQRSAKFARTPAGRPAQVHGRSTAQTSNGTTAVPGPQGAFADGTKGQARQTLFNTIAPVYDELNERLSFGRHWGWKRDAVRRSGAAPGDRALDVCCGSGDLTYLLADAVGQQGSVVGFDFAQDMLDYAVQRGHPKPSRNCAPADIEWLQGDAMQLPFGNASFDAATMGYGLRNIADPSKALQELHRVLRPGATAAILDFNNCPDPIVDGLQSFFLSNLVVPAARRRGLEDEYAYLRPSIQAFPTGPGQERMALQAGFAEAKHLDVEFGLMGCLLIQKAAG